MRLLAVALLALTLLGCDKPDDVTRIRTLVEDAVVHAEKQNLKGLMEHVTDDFAANPGNHDEQSVRGILLITLRQYGNFDIKHPVPGIKLADDTQSAEVSLPFWVVRDGESFPSVTELQDDPARWVEAVGEAVGDPYRLQLSMVKKDGDWKVSEATIQGTRTIGSGGFRR